MIIEVYRGEGSRSGSPVIEPLLADTVLIERGRAEMDANARALNSARLSVVPRPGLRLGQLVEASDPSSATAWRGKVTGIEIRASLGLIEQTLVVEVPASMPGS